jgi:hypothetical protein
MGSREGTHRIGQILAPPRGGVGRISPELNDYAARMSQGPKISSDHPGVLDRAANSSTHSQIILRARTFFAF